MNEIKINKPGKTTFIMYTVYFGSCDEKPEHYGIAHMIEHLLFKGSKNYKKGVLEQFVEHSGGILNAFTCQEITAYWCLIDSKLANKADKMMYDMVTNPLFPTKEITKERDVIIQEYKMYEADPDDQVCNLFNEAVYSKHSGLNHPIIGTLKTIKSITPKDIKKYYNNHYNCISKIIIGNVENSINIKGVLHRDREDKKIPSDIYETQAGIQQSHMIIGNRINKVDYFTAALIEAIMNDMTGRLFQKIREEKHLVYGINFDIEFFHISDGTWSVKAAMDKKNINRAREMIIKELTRIPTKKELDIALQKCIGKVNIAMEKATIIGETVSFAPIHGTNIEDILFNYEKNFKLAKDRVIGIMKQINFNNNIMVAIFPGK